MPECHFCQVEIEDTKSFCVSAPDQTTTHFCSECMGGILKFFKSGEAMKDEVVENKIHAPHLAISPRDHKLCCVFDSRPIEVFHNFHIQKFDIQNGRFMNYGYPLSNTMSGFQTECIVKIEGMLVGRQAEIIK